MSNIYGEKEKILFDAVHSVGQMTYRMRLQDKNWGKNETPLEIYNLWISRNGFPVDPKYLTMLLEHIDYLRTGPMAIIGEALYADELISEVERDIGTLMALEDKKN